MPFVQVALLYTSSLFIQWRKLKKEIKMFTQICLWLTIIGGLNWGLVGIFDFNLVALIFGDMTILARLVYTVVGLSAIWVAWDALRSRYM